MLSVRSPQKYCPFIVQKVHSAFSSNRKYAPKFVNHFVFSSQNYLLLRTRYLKTISHISYSSHDSSLERKTLKILKRFAKVCKGLKESHLKIPPIFSSVRIYQIANIVTLPLSFKLTKYNSLHLELVRDSLRRAKYDISKLTSRLVRNISRNRSLQELFIYFNPDSVELLISLLAHLEKSPLSPKIFRLHYLYPSGDAINELSNKLSDLQKVTHFVIEIRQINTLELDFQHLENLTSLSLIGKLRYKDSFSHLVSLKNLANLIEFLFDARIFSESELEDFLRSFHLPKSIRILALTLDMDYMKGVRPFGFLQNRPKEVKAHPKKKSFFSNLWFRKPKTEPENTTGTVFQDFCQQFTELEILSDLSLNIETDSDPSNTNFLFITSILKCCKSLTRVACKTNWERHLLNTLPLETQPNTTGRSNSSAFSWEDFLKVISHSKETIEFLDIHANFFSKEKDPFQSNLQLKKLKKFRINTPLSRGQNLNGLMSIIAQKNNQELTFTYKIAPIGELEIKQLFSFISYVRTDVILNLKLSIQEGDSVVLWNELLDFLGRAKIEGQINIYLDPSYKVDPSKLEPLFEWIKKKKNFSMIGSLEVYYWRHGDFEERLLFKTKKESLFCL